MSKRAVFRAIREQDDISSFLCGPKWEWIVKLLLGLLLTVVPPGCVRVQVEPFVHQTFPKTNGPIAALDEKPNGRYLAVAKIFATTDSATENSLRSHILARAALLGADAVIFGKVDLLESMGASPAYQSTLTPAGTSLNPYGWWTPFYLDPWSFVQGAADQRDWTLYLSGIAIRYDRETPRDTKRSPVHDDRSVIP